MKSKNTLCGISIAVVLQMGMLAGFAQTNKYLFSGSKTNITLLPGTYIITAHGAPGGGGYAYTGSPGGGGGGYGYLGNGGQNVIISPLSGSQMFFRLH